MMEAGAVLLLLLLQLGTLCVTSDANFYGNSVNFMAQKRNKDGTFMLSFHHRQNGRNVCQNQTEFRCDDGVCTSLNGSGVAHTDQDDTGQGKWCQSESFTMATIQTTKSLFRLRSSGCCWLPNREGKTTWTSEAELNLGTRSDKLGYNHCPVTATVAALRVPQDCFSRIPLLAHDPDGDHVKCSFAPNATVPVNVSLDEAGCTLTRTGQVETGVHVFELMLEDFPSKNITLSHADGTTEQRTALNMSSEPLCRVKLQFSVEVLPPLLNCEAGRSMPVFLFPTPSQSSVLYATVGQNFQLTAAAQAYHARISSFQVSGPANMNKTFTEGQNGKAQLTLNWIPQERDAHRSAPVCFTAETNQTQSEMRCVVVMVTRSTHRQGVATVQCLPDRITVTLEKASMPDLDMNYLRLKDPTCSLTSNLTHIIGAMSFTTCGTRVEEDGDYIVFANSITSFQLPNETIVRRRTVNIDFSCRFPKLLSISSGFNMHDSDFIFTETNFGTFGYSFDIYPDSSFTEKMQARAYPVSVKLLQTIYMGIQAKSDLPNVKLFVESCKGTPDDNSDNPIYYDLIKDGCIMDETVKIYPSKQTTFNFELQSFKFTDYDQVYITCYIILCDSDSIFSRCAQGCMKSPTRRRRRGLSLETERHSIVQGPLQFVEEEFSVASVDDSSGNAYTPGRQNNTPVFEEVPSAPESGSVQRVPEGSWNIRQALSSKISTAVFASLFLASLLLTVAVVVYFTMKKKAEDQRLLLAPASIKSDVRSSLFT
ncbi:uncharacterized protein LOC130514772 [Takifugu flavidus]|uniref:Oncoprotein-induced transcript 3 protein n=1 Tax=Takifugu flavidus TaxID=433684 RepID=A0A5C6NKY0_9TELE|nr:uncharacterized protein LOC130514772 [Takifugu flavidus]TWW67595.1 Oncoprotein-induced transcript 3 protein [Takifugu flavidus]